MTKEKGHPDHYSGKEFIKRGTLIHEFGITDSLIESSLPKPARYQERKDRSGYSGPLWNRREIADLFNTPEFQELLKKEKKRQKKEFRRKKNSNRQDKRKAAEKQLADYLLSFTPEELFARARMLHRTFVVHVGPTNSGKTHDALLALRDAESGVYLGPLRLLALEVFDRLNADGCPCSLLTGEEREDVACARKTASTIELCDYSELYEVAVIDEAQMIADPDRGAHWAKAICLVQARTVHICLAPEALDLILSILDEIGAPRTVVTHDRLVPLVFSGVFPDLSAVQDGDALISFSRKGVLGLAGLLDKKKKRASVIYGALPPAARREEVRRFAEGETTIVVATDAIGMGISLPIKRIIFMETDKFDGIRRRPLTAGEIKQIAGRAGRFGMYDLGEVLTVAHPTRIREALSMETTPVRQLRVPFPKEALDSEYSLQRLLRAWGNLPDSKSFLREDVSSALYLLGQLEGVPKKQAGKAFLYDLVSCPVDTKSSELVFYWKTCAAAILSGKPVPAPFFGDYTLEECELQYRAYDIRHQLLRRIGIEEDCTEEKTALCERINLFLSREKTDYIRKCRICGKELAFNSAFGICDSCHKVLERSGSLYRIGW